MTPPLFAQIVPGPNALAIADAPAMALPCGLSPAPVAPGALPPAPDLNPSAGPDGPPQP